MVVGYISGMVRAWTRGELCSRVGIMGIVKKAAYLLAVVVAIVADWVVRTAAELFAAASPGFLTLCQKILALLLAYGKKIPAPESRGGEPAYS